MKHMLTAAVLAIMAGTAAVAQQVRPLPQAKLFGELQKLQSLTSVLYVAAHPDDENTRLLSWLATGQHIRTAYLSLTRGDGGQNIIGGELGPALGLIRTNELLAARGLDGAGQYFSRAIDFGYSKTAEETFNHWDVDLLTEDVVRVIEQFRPDVMICRFPASRMAGHGQHEASAIIAKNAFDACNKRIRPTRLLFNAYRFGQRSTIADSMFTMDVGQYDPLIGMGYGELAGMSRSLHKSQGAGTPSTPGVQAEYFETLGGEPPTKSLFDGIDTTWNRVGRPDIGAALDALISKFWQGAPHELLPELFRVRRMIAEISDPFWRDLKTKQINTVILSAMGVTADMSVAEPTVVAGATVPARVRVVARAGVAVALEAATFVGQDLSLSTSLQHDSLWVADLDVTVPRTVAPTSPYWSGKIEFSELFSVSDESLAGLPMTPSQLPVELTLSVMGERVVCPLNLSYKQLDPLRGDVIEELRIVPPVSVEPEVTTVLASTASTVNIRLRAFQAFSNATLMVGVMPLDLVDGFTSKASPALASVQGISMHANTDTLITVALPESGSDHRIGVEINGHMYEHAVRVISYDHLPTLQYLEEARITVIPDAIACTAKRVAFIAGAGEATPDFLRSLGVVVDEISDETILRTDELLTYDAVLVGIRAINVHASLQFLMPALMSYVEQGGTLVMQYNTAHRMSTEDIGPFPLPLSRERVTEEDAAVTMLKPTHRLFQSPNALTGADFDGWVQERGLYFPLNPDPRYERLLSMHDTGEDPLDGSLLYAQYGKGHFVYCALSLFRQIPGGVPGGMKLMANMLSVGQ